MSFDGRPELSVIVPVLNEEGNLPSFLEGVARQRGVRLELIVSDGGSADGSVAAAETFAADAPFPVRVIVGTGGRGAQMNRGVETAAADLFLFLHVDSSFEDPLAFRKGIDHLLRAAGDGAQVAGRFALTFAFDGKTPLPYSFYGAKATLDRPGCIHGDQGFLVGREFFGEIGPYDTLLPLMEDTFFAERVREAGRWLLLPARIATSPRRFLTEGLLPRQALNAILMNLASIGRLSLLQGMKKSYRSQDTATRLELRPLLGPLDREVALLPAAERRRFWYQTGSYVRSNAWQIAFLLDFLCGGASDGKGGRFLSLYDKVVGRLIDHRAGNWGAAALTWLWFRLTLYAAR